MNGRVDEGRAGVCRDEPGTLPRDELIEKAARALCDQGILALNGSEATWERHADGFRGMAEAILVAIGLIPEHVTDYATTCPTCEAAADRPCDHFPVQMLAGAPRFVLPSRPEHVTATEER